MVAESSTGTEFGRKTVDRKATKVTALRTERVKAKMELALVQIECILADFLKW